MPRNEDFAAALKKFRRDFEENINERALRRGEEISEQIAQKFVGLVKSNLDRADPAPESKGIIESIKESIHYDKTSRALSRRQSYKGKYPKVAEGYVAYIPVDKEGMVMFLEYGTGLKGKENPHPESVEAEVEGFKIGWRYAVHLNESRPVTHSNRFGKKITENLPYYVNLFGKKGFVFKKKNNNYIDREDIVFKSEKKVKYNWVKGYVRKDGTRVKPYTRYSKKGRTITSKTQYVLSSGIKPTRFVYDAKQEIKRLINEGKFK